MQTTPSAAATLVGASAVLMWGLLALLTALSDPVPPFQLTAMTFTIAAALMATKWALYRQRPMTYLRQPARIWLIGVGGLFGYHFLYFMALRNAPPVQASLIAYLWPLLIVLMSALLPGERLRWWHVAGALAGLAGAAILIVGPSGLALRGEYWLGYLLAFGCALTWSSYSLLSRGLRRVPTDTVGGFCAITAILATMCHTVFETTRWPLDAVQWGAVIGLGLGPVGLAFYTWDYGVKRGNIRLLGVLSYFAPLISTLLLVAFGAAPATGSIFAACALIVGGALLAALDLLRRAGPRA